MPAKNLNTGQLGDIARTITERKLYEVPENQPIIDLFANCNTIEELTTTLYNARKHQVKKGEWTIENVRYFYQKRWDEVLKMKRKGNNYISSVK